MKNDLQFCPGNSLSSFLRAISFDLQGRQIEYLVIAFFNKNEFPIAMRQITGRTSWVAYPVDTIIAEAKEINSTGVCIIHNHPASYGEKPSLRPSPEDISFQQLFLGACQSNNLTYLGSWISSRGQITEVLYYTWQEAIRKQYTFRDDELLTVNYGLTPTFNATVQSLTKPNIIVSEEYEIGQIMLKTATILQNDSRMAALKVSVRSTYSLNAATEYTYQLNLFIVDSEYNSSMDTFSFEEVTRTCYALFELHEASKRLSDEKTADKTLTISLTENSICGSFKKESEQTAFLTIGNRNYLFSNLDELLQLHLLFDKALKHLESLER